MLDNMVGYFKFFDAYTLKARLFPALVAGFPSISVPLVFISWSSLSLSNIIVATTSIIMFFAFSEAARRSGLRIEKKLGTRSTPELWHRSNSEISNISKDNYRNFVSSKIGYPAPNEVTEIENPKVANDFYLSAANWLRGQTKDTKKFSILFSDNISYGYWRNLLGLKPMALALNAIITAACGLCLYYSPTYLDKIPHATETLIGVLIIVAFHTSYMLFAVSRRTVREASTSYGRQLILSCETLMNEAKPAARRKKV